MIAEVKTRSPYGYRSTSSFKDLLAKAIRVGDVISIHTDHRWGGDLHDVELAAKMTNKPILAKGIHWSDHEVGAAFKAGATWVLTVGRQCNHPQTWYEPTVNAWVSWIGKTTNGNDVRVVNARNLQDGKLHTELFDIARKIHQGPLIQASGIKSPDDVHPDADGFIVGEALWTWPE